MKHPKFRCKDILVMDRDVLKETVGFVDGVLQKYCPFYADIADLEIVGSMAFGVNTLSSDWDFNVAMKDYNAQVPAKQWWHTPSQQRADMQRALMAYMTKYDLHLDVGCADPISQRYNVVASTRKWELYNRGRGPLPLRTPAIITPFPLFPLGEPFSTIDIMSFDWTKAPLPDTFKQHLVYDGYASMFLGQDRNFKRQSLWASDPWADEVPFWKEKYGDRFQGYHETQVKHLVTGEAINQLEMD
jgi:hypothetical protein